MTNEIKTKNNLVYTTGLFSALFSAIFYILFDIAAIAGMTGTITSKFWISITWYTPSIFLAYSFLFLVCSIHFLEENSNKFFSFIAITLAIIYVTLNSFVYISQILIIAPSFLNNSFESVSVFELAENKPLYAVNDLAYTLMGLSTFFLSFCFTGKRLSKAIKIMLFIHGVVAPTMIGAFLYKPLFIISSTVGFTYPISAILLTIYFYKKKSSNN